MDGKGALYWSHTNRRVHGHITVATRGPFSFNFSLQVNSCRLHLEIDASDKEKNDELFNALYDERDSIHDAIDVTLRLEQQSQAPRELYRLGSGRNMRISLAYP